MNRALLLSILLTASALVVLPSASAEVQDPTTLVWSSGTAVATGAVTSSGAGTIDNDGTKVGFVYTNVTGSPTGCHFGYGDVTGWRTTTILGNVTTCYAVKFVGDHTWIVWVVTNPAPNPQVYVLYESTDDGLTWNPKGIPVQISGGINYANYIVHKKGFYSIMPLSGGGTTDMYTTNGGVTWSSIMTGTGGCPVATNGFTSADIEAPVSYTSTTLTFSKGFRGSSLYTLNMLSGTCTTTATNNVEFDAQNNPPAYTSKGFIMYEGGVGAGGSPVACGSGTIPSRSFYDFSCRVVYVGNETTNYGTSINGFVSAFTLKGAVGSFLYMPNSAAGDDVKLVLYDSTSSAVADISSVLGAWELVKLSATMVGNELYILYYRVGGGTLFVTTEIAVSEDLEVPDFGTGLQAFMAGIGFITPASQFFFALILIGLTSVTLAIVLKAMGSGRTKMITITVAAMLLGVFCVVLSLFDLWIYTLGLVLGVFIIRGSRDARNTYYELQRLIRDRVVMTRSREVEGGEEEIEEQAQSKSFARVSGEEVEESPSDEEYSSQSPLEDSSQSTGSPEP